MTAPPVGAASSLPFPTERLPELTEGWVKILIAAKDFVPPVGVCVDWSMQLQSEPQLPADPCFTNWAEFGTLEQAGQVLRLQLAVFDRDIDPGDLLQYALESRGATFLARRDQYVETGLDSDILTLQPVADGEALVSRSVCGKHGRCVFWCEALVRQRDYVQRADVLWQLLSQIRIEAPVELHAEPLAEYVLDDPMFLQFSHPQSWNVFRSELGEDLCHLTVESRANEKTTGRVNVVVQRGGESRMLIERCRNILHELKITVPPLEFDTVTSPRGTVRYGLPDIRLVDAEGKPLDFYAAYFRYGDDWIWMDCLSLPREETPIWWMIHRRCFETVAWSLKTAPTAAPVVTS